VGSAYAHACHIPCMSLFHAATAASSKRKVVWSPFRGSTVHNRGENMPCTQLRRVNPFSRKIGKWRRTAQEEDLLLWKLVCTWRCHVRKQIWEPPLAACGIPNPPQTHHTPIPTVLTCTFDLIPPIPGNPLFQRERLF
jgi:hypothetical protein